MIVVVHLVDVNHSVGWSDKACFRFALFREIEKFIIRQPPTGEKDDYDSENSWISDGLPSSSRRRRRGKGRGEGGEVKKKRVK